MGVDDDFEAFWLVYPRRKDKGHARIAYRRARQKLTRDMLDLAAARFAVCCRGKDVEFIPYPATWLNGERWGDESDSRQVLSQVSHDVREQAPYERFKPCVAPEGLKHMWVPGAFKCPRCGASPYERCGYDDL